jgi:putative DNA primase/helicase
MSERNGHCGIQVVPQELLEALAAEAPVSPSASTNGTAPKSSANSNASSSTASSNGKYTSRLLVDRWLQDRGIEFRVKSQPDGKNRTVYVLKQCLFDPSHGDPDSCIMQAPDGKMSAQCFHNSCSGKGWQAFKEAIGKPEGHHYDPPLKSAARSGVKIGNGTATADNSGQKDKPSIVLGTDEYRVNSEAIEALSNHETAPEVFQRGNMLVRVQRTPKAGKQSRIDRPEGTPRISAMAAPSVCELLTRVAEFLKPVSNKKGATELVPAHPPDRCVAAVVARGNWPDIRPLEGVLEAPTLRPDWTILDTPGWDTETGLLYEPNADYPSILPTPSKTDAIQAADRLLDLVRDFPFVGTDSKDNEKRDSHRAAWLAGLVTAVVRHAIAGPCPLFLFDANCPGTGKSMLADIIALISTGRVISRTAFPNNDEELRKRLTAVALAGDRLLLFDNIEAGQPFGGASLDAALTGTTWQDRILGRSKMTPELPLHTLFFATGNNVILKGDALRRVLPCRLETKEENPEEREDFKYPNLLGHVRANRPQLICDVLTLLRGFAVAGLPEESLPAFGSYEAWSAVVRQPVFWVMGVDPWSTRKGLRASDPALNNLAALLEGWAELPGGRTGLTVAEALRILNNPDHKDDYLPLRAAWMEWSRTDRLPGAGQIGCKLRSLRHRVVNGQALDSDTGRGGGQLWRVIPASTLTAFGDDGDDGDDA